MVGNLPQVLPTDSEQVPLAYVFHPPSKLAIRADAKERVAAINECMRDECHFEPPCHTGRKVMVQYDKVKIILWMNECI